MVLSEIGRARVRQVFDALDKDQSGSISRDELLHACNTLSVTVTREDIDSFVTTADTGGDGTLNFKEFCDFYESRLSTVFSMLDSDNSGDISVDELQTAFSKLGYKPTRRELNVLISQVDANQDGLVNFKEFCDYFSSLPSPDMRSIVEQWASGLSVDTGTDLAPPTLPPASVSIWRALFAGGLAGIVSRTATAPLEKIKLLAQTSSQQYRIIPTIKEIVKKEKLVGLFSGNGVNCLRVFPFSALVCLAYSSLAKYFPLSDNNSLRGGGGGGGGGEKKSFIGSAITGRMMAGFMAGTFATVLTHPMDVVRAKLTVQQQHPGTTGNGMINTTVTIWQTQGIRGLYRGLVPTLVAIGPFIGIQQSSYDMIKHYLTVDKGLNSSPLLFLTCGSISGITAQTVVYPLDVIRRQMQVHSHLNNPFTVARSLFINKKLFAGLTPTYLKVMPSVAISLLVRDALLGRLKK